VTEEILLNPGLLVDYHKLLLGINVEVVSTLTVEKGVLCIE
jgi:hypothetical protein